MSNVPCEFLDKDGGGGGGGGGGDEGGHGEHADAPLQGARQFDVGAAFRDRLREGRRGEEKRRREEKRGGDEEKRREVVTR